jgi:hypothetical protein
VKPSQKNSLLPIGRTFLLSLATAVTACAPAFRAEVVGRTSVATSPAAAGPDSPIAATIDIAESQDAQVLRYAIGLPRALQLRYRVTCPGAEREGTLGETFEQYRARRLAELERERKAAASLVGAIVGALAPPVSANARLNVAGGAGRPEASLTAGTQVDPAALAASAAHDALPAPELPFGETGAQVIRGRLELAASPAGRCRLAFWSELPGQDTSGVQVNAELSRIVDIDAERQARNAAEQARQRQLGREVRARVVAGLVRSGADPLARARARAAADAMNAELQRRRADEQQRRQDAKDRLDREAQERRDAWLAARRRRESEALQRGHEARRFVLAGLLRLGADPDLRRRQEEDRIRVRREQQQRLWIERQRSEEHIALERRWALELRRGLIARLVASGADPNYRRLRDEAELRAFEAEQRGLAEARRQAAERVRMETQAALDLRVLAKLRLHRAGAIDRPPAPPPIAENPPAALYVGAVWIGGRYEWNGLTWFWSGGHYQRPPDRASVWVPALQIAVDGTVVVRPGRWVRMTNGSP